MAATKFSYHRLRNEADNDIELKINQSKAGIRWPSSRLKKMHIKKRLRMRIPSLRRFMRRKARVFMASMVKVLKRLKESQSHFGDLFAGNYLFLQVTPTPLKSSSYEIVNRECVKRIEDRFC